MLNSTLYSAIYILAYLLITSGLIREEYIHFIDRQPFQQAKAWAPVVGQIGEFATAPVAVPDGRLHTHEEYKVRVRYKYAVAGVSYFGQQDKFFDYQNQLGLIPPAQWGEPSFVTYTKETELKMAAEFAEGSEHVVRYDPQHPSRSFIDIKVAPDSADDWKRKMIIGGALGLGIVVRWVVKSYILFRL